MARFDQVANALGHQMRRQILVELLDRNPVAIGSACERDDSEIKLIHNHLPKLDSMGYVVWDRNNGTVVKGPNWEEIGPVVRLLRNNRNCIPNGTFSHIEQS